MEIGRTLTVYDWEEYRDEICSAGDTHRMYYYIVKRIKIRGSFPSTYWNYDKKEPCTEDIGVDAQGREYHSHRQWDGPSSWERQSDKRIFFTRPLIRPAKSIAGELL